MSNWEKKQIHLKDQNCDVFYAHLNTLWPWSNTNQQVPPKKICQQPNASLPNIILPFFFQPVQVHTSFHLSIHQTTTETNPGRHKTTRQLLGKWRKIEKEVNINVFTAFFFYFQTSSFIFKTISNDSNSISVVHWSIPDKSENTKETWSHQVLSERNLTKKEEKNLFLELNKYNKFSWSNLSRYVNKCNKYALSKLFAILFLFFSYPFNAKN